MTDIDARPRMTPDDIALMREIAKWRKNHGVLYLYPGAPWLDSRTGRAMSLTEDGDIGITEDHQNGPYEWYRVHSFIQGVDLLVALGYLPARFSSAYRAGWHASHVWHDDRGAFPSDEFERLFHDPENVSFPAGMDVP